jgi:hypothetical protein
MVCAPSCRGGRQAACRKGVAIQSGGLRQDVAKSTGRTGRPPFPGERVRPFQLRRRQLVRECVVKPVTGVAPLPIAAATDAAKRAFWLAVHEFGEQIMRLADENLRR